MNQTKRLLLNVIATNGRSLYAMACGLLTGRWMLLSLGAQDYGLLGLVGGLIAFMAIFNGIFSTAISRYYAFSLGEINGKTDANRYEDCRRWFTLALVIHIVIPGVIFGIGWPIGEWAVIHWLTIPGNRIQACQWVFRFSCISCLVGVLCVPYRAMYIAKQEIAELTIYSFVTSTLNVLVLYYMVTHQGDWLVMMAAWMMLMVVVPAVIIAVRATYIYPECQFRWSYVRDWGRLRQLFAFAGWQFLGNVGAMLRDQGNAILVNKFLGPVFNATNTIANTVSGHTQMFANEMNGAFAPAITTTCGARDYKFMNILVQRCNKYSGLAVAFLAIPLILEMEEVMKLWLKTPPPDAAAIAVCTCLACLVNKLTSGQWMAVNAFGRVAKINIAEFGSYILMVIMTGTAFYFGGKVIWVGYSMLIALLLLSILRILIGYLEGNISIFEWMRYVLVPVGGVVVVSLGIGGFIRFWMEPSFLRIVITSLLSLSCFSMMSWFWVLDKTEREYVITRIRRRFSH